MKKLKIISNIFWMMSLIIMELVILQKFEIIRFLPKPVTLEEIYTADDYIRLINIIGYIFLLLSISIKFFLFMQSQDTRILSINSKYLKMCILLFKILLVILTLIVLTISLLITLITLIDFSHTPM